MTALLIILYVVGMVLSIILFILYIRKEFDITRGDLIFILVFSLFSWITFLAVLLNMIIRFLEKYDRVVIKKTNTDIYLNNKIEKISNKTLKKWRGCCQST